MKARVLLLTAACAAATLAGYAPEHPRLLFNASDVAGIRARAKLTALEPAARRVIDRANWQLGAPPIVPSITKRGEPDPPGEQKGIASARALQGRVLTHCMAFTLTRELKYRDAAVRELRRAIDDWRIWVDTAHAPPYDLMTGENALTFGLAYDWLYHDLSAEERAELRRGAERRALAPYLESIGRERPPAFFTARHNWNPVCNGGAAVLALAFQGESDLSDAVLERAIPAMDHYWKHLADDGGWDEGTGYWAYGHRYAFIAAEALRRSGRPGGAQRFALPGAARTGYFPLVFNPGQTVTAGFGDSNSRVADPILYLLGRAYQNPDFIWFQDRAPLRAIDRDGWPQDALTLVWRPAGEAWLPEARPGFEPALPPTYVFPSIGWAFMAPRQPAPPFFLSFKNGSLAANHTHLDLNHVSVGAGETMLAVELGSRPYPADYFSPRRYSYYEITTAGHNTVTIGGKGQVHGKAGTLLGPYRGERYEALVGVADGAYEAAALRARRHVVFVDRRYWVLLDEIQTDAPEPVEVRFHTYGAAQERGTRWWTFFEAPHMLDIVPGPSVVTSIETADGWIRPVRVLSMKTKEPAREHALVTVLHARRADAPPPSPIEVRQTDAEIVVTVGQDRVSFRQAAHGWAIAGVSSTR